MNDTQNQNRQAAGHASLLAESQFARRVATRLDASVGTLPYDVSERLRAARVQAVAQRRLAAVQTASGLNHAGGAATLSFGGDRPGLWTRLASAIPLVALVAGLVAINMVQADNRASELAEVDAALLTDDLPPAAYADPGFAQYLQSGSDNFQ